MNDYITRQDAIKFFTELWECIGTIGDREEWEDVCVTTANEIKSAQPESQWIPCSERPPEENHWLGGSGKQFSDEVLVNVVNYDDEDMWVYISQTIDGMWALELPRHCEITAWRELPEPYAERRTDG